MLVDAHCHIDAYPRPALALAAGEAAGIRTIAVTTSLISYVRTSILCRHQPSARVALGLHPQRVGAGYDQWAEWRQVLEGAPLLGEVGLDFSSGDETSWAAQARTFAEVAKAGEGKVLMVHSALAEAEVLDTLTSAKAQRVIWHGLRPEAPRVLLYRAIEAGHWLSVGPDLAAMASFRARLRAIPRERVLTETNGPWGRLGTGDRAAALREVLAVLAEAWRCTPSEAEGQVERNWAGITAGIETELMTTAEHAERAV